MNGQRAFLGPHFGASQLNQHLSLSNMLAFTHSNGIDHPAIAVLNRLAVTGDDQLSTGVSGSIERRERCPPQKNDEEQRGRDKADAQVAARAVDILDLLAGHRSG